MNISIDTRADITQDLESRLFRYTNRNVLCSCFEVTIGFYGNERVDYLSLDYNGTWRFYEIKSCNADYKSKAKHTFYGHLNYYVMPFSVYEQVKKDIPCHVGVLCETDNRGYYYLDLVVIKRPKRQELIVDDKLLTYCMMRSLNRVKHVPSYMRNTTKERGNEIAQEIK